MVVNLYQIDLNLESIRDGPAHLLIPGLVIAPCASFLMFSDLLLIGIYIKLIAFVIVLYLIFHNSHFH